MAKEEFEEIRDIDPSRISICVNGVVTGRRQLIRVGPAAWDAVMDSLSRYEILDILVKNPRIVVNTPDSFFDTLPNYEDVKKASGNDDKLISASRAPSPLSGNTALRSSSRSSSRSPSRPQKPKTDWAKTISFFGRHD